nr:hypothetical protein Iba_chr09eCG4020 [Ipomoea batatas]
MLAAPPVPPCVGFSTVVILHVIVRMQSLLKLVSRSMLKLGVVSLEAVKVLNKAPQIGVLKEAQVFQMLGHMEQSFEDEGIFNLNVSNLSAASSLLTASLLLACCSFWSHSCLFCCRPQDHSHNSDPASYTDNPSDVALGIVCASPQSHFALSFAHHGIR